MLSAELRVNGHLVGQALIVRRKDQVDPPPPDAVLVYDYTLRTQRSGGYDACEGVVTHRYGDDAWTLVRKVIESCSPGEDG